MTDFQPKLGDRNTLNAFELEILDTKVLPTARQWTVDYPEGSSLWSHAKQTLRHWGESHE